MKIITLVGLIFVSYYFFNKICIWLENNGFLYYRNKKPETGLTGNLLLELHAALNPSTRHVIEMKQKAAKQLHREANVPGELKK